MAEGWARTFDELIVSLDDAESKRDVVLPERRRARKPKANGKKNQTESCLCRAWRHSKAFRSEPELRRLEVAVDGGAIRHDLFPSKVDYSEGPDQRML
jgi:hypothetical protein